MLQESLLHELEHEGLSREAAYRVVKLLSSAPQALLSTAEEKIYGLSRQALGNAVADGITMGVAFLVGALVPLLPFILIPSAARRLLGLIAAMATTALALFAVGYFQGWLAQRKRRWLSGLRFLAVAMGAAVIGYLIGLAIAPLGGGAPIPWRHEARGLLVAGRIPCPLASAQARVRRRAGRGRACPSAPRWTKLSRRCGPRSAPR